MIRCQKCGATNADGRPACSVCGTALNHRFTAEIESDVIAAIAALAPERGGQAPAAAPPAGSVAERLSHGAASPTVVRHEGPRTLFGRGASGSAGSDDVPHPVLDGVSEMPTTILRDRGLGPMFGQQAAPQRGSTAEVSDEGTFFGIGTVAGDESVSEATAFGVPVAEAADSAIGQRPNAVPDWLSSLEEELRDSDEFDRFVGPGPSDSAVGRDQSGTGVRTEFGRKQGPRFDLDGEDAEARTDPGIPGDAPAAASGDAGAGVLRKKRTQRKAEAGPTKPRTQRRDIRFEEEDAAGAERGVAFDSTFEAGPSSTVASPAAGPARPTVNDLGFADTGALDALNADARQRIAARTGGAPTSGPHPRRSPATGSSSPRPARAEPNAPDAAWDVFVPPEGGGEFEVSRSSLPSAPVTGQLAPAAPPAPSSAMASARRIVLTVAAVVVIVCLAFGAFLVWLVDL